MKDVIKITGRLRIYALHPAPELVFDTHNHITDVGLNLCISLLAGGVGDPVVEGTGLGPETIAQGYITQMKIGDIAANILQAPDDLDTGLQGDVIHTWTVADEELTVQYPAPASIRFTSVLLPTELIDFTLTEEALFTSGGLCAARATIAQKATGTITFVGNPADGNHVTLNDGVITKRFEFDNNNSITIGSIRVEIGATTSDSVSNLIAAINASTVAIDATNVTSTQIALVAQRFGIGYNHTITTSGLAISATGMTGGTDGTLKTGAFGLQFDHDIQFARG